MYVSKEATLREVMAEVSIADLGGQLKTALKGLGCLAIWLVALALIDAFGDNIPAINNIHFPRLVWIAILVGFVVASTLVERSYHDWKFQFWFPKVGFLGWLFLTTYITGTIEAFRVIYGYPTGSPEGWIAFAVAWTFLVIPAALFLELCQVGHARLMEKRTAAASGSLEIKHSSALET